MDKNNKIVPSEAEQARSSSSSPRPRKQSWQDEPKRTASLESLEDYGEPLKFDPDFSGPVKKRGCTGMPTYVQISKCYSKDYCSII